MLTATVFTDAPERPLLLLGSSVGTSAESLWARCAARLHGRYHVVGFDLPGHGRSTPAPGPFSIADLAAALLELADRLRPGERFLYAGDSIGGAIGLELLLAAPERIAAAALLCTGAKIGEPELWAERAALVRAEGTGAVVAGSAERWFTAGFPESEREPLLDALRATDDESYARCCEALAGFDVRERLAEIVTPVLAVAGGQDKPTPPEGLRLIAESVLHGRLVVLDEVAHLAPAESPEVVAFLLDQHFEELRAAGTAVRREVLGAAHVDRTTAATTPFTRDFQDLITRYAWGEIWTRPGLDRRGRSIVTLTALVALGHHEELAMHVRAARTNGLTTEEIKEVLLQTAIYCGVPAANAAFRIAQHVLADVDSR
ncbi:bifunctional 3-oxoadipate enol-lactonase/4-carboxymuconolactone decarboxylase PcaDC [Actinoplanes regularis]|uniref:4-carboxymuconolactone decarboxylase /3-oxoadipate enol-lactonase n=1 Tax=Actinoplanes regularis TaxID=52697 RepID=A0A239EQF3_9ACTN|nr:4-carboxymuconolactone decarboxylase [Actinoplanes regularis]GIE89867.1 3-oxoadipate enol-lactonase [Actinoplanes regularis]SNS46094.1 4-carboxymuconolactone decarboxylase /3-oxoadipate enol-lactonase [Actinoplanes regularis]